MRRSFLAGLLAAVSALPSPAFAQREDLSIISDKMSASADVGQRGEFRGQRGEAGQRGDGGGFRQRGDGGGFRQQPPQAQPVPQAQPAPQVQQGPPQQPSQQRGDFRQDRFQNREQFQQNGFRNDRQFRPDRGFQQPQYPQQNAPVFNGQPRPDNGARGNFRDDRRDDGRQGFRGQPGVGQSGNFGRGDERFDNNRFGGDRNPFNNGYRSGNGWNDNRGYQNRGYDNRGYDNRGFGNRGVWNRDWRSNNQYDWRGYRNYNRDSFRLPRYYAPNGWGYGYRRFGIGLTLNSVLFDQNYWIDDAEYYRLPPAYGPYRWVRYYNDALLVDLRSGYVVDAVYDIFY